MATRLKSITPGQDPLDGMSLPGWLYFDPEFFEAEKKAFLRAAPQVVCHESEIAEPGEWRTLEYLGESVIVIRGDDGEVRAFSNVCRHRGSRLVDGTRRLREGADLPLPCVELCAATGGWSAFRTAQEYPGLQPEKLGLHPVALEKWRGFLFVTLEPGAPSVAEMMAPYEDEVAPYRFEDLRVMGRVTLRPRPLNWKTIADNYSDHLHIPVGPSRPDAAVRAQLPDRGAGPCRPDGRRSGREGVGQPVRARLPAPSSARSIICRRAHQRKWLYYKLFPNVAFDIYPDQVDFMQFLPVSATETVIREISYALPDEPRAR